MNQDRIAQTFRRGLASYGRAAQVQKDGTSRLLDLFALVSAQTRFENVFEFGAGTGFLTRALLDRFQIGTLTLNDLLPEAEHVPVLPVFAQSFAVVGRDRSVGEAHVAHVVDGEHMNMGVWHFEPSDHHANARRLPDLFDGFADVVRHRHEMFGHRGVEVEPMVDFDTRHDQRVAVGDWIDRQKADTGLV